jgi:hypothetical protein
MNKEFIPYEEALALKELGFDEECFGWYDDTNKEFYPIRTTDKVGENASQAPLYQQAFRWFREKYGLIKQDYMFITGVNNHAFIVYDKIKSSNLYDCCYNDDGEVIGSGFVEYEEAELTCLKKLIEIVKEK